MYVVDRIKLPFLINDLISAAWVETIDLAVTDAQLVHEFRKLHQELLSRLDREERGYLSKVPISQLAEVVRGWVRLYRCTLTLLRRQHPRTAVARDLTIDDVNWSEALAISADGLLLIDHSSRYAELWAERAITTENGFSSLGDRMSFVGSDQYNAYANLVQSGELLVLDRVSNGVTSYDMKMFIESGTCQESQFETEIQELGWFVETGSRTAIARLFRIFSNPMSGVQS